MSPTNQTVASLGDRLQVSIHSEPLRNPDVDLEQYVGVFHDWIRQSALGAPGGLLIDVASYAHVPNGPGVLLIGHEFDYGVRIALGRVGLTCRHKRDPSGEGNALKRCLRQLLQAAQLLESAPKLSETPSFDASEFVFRSNDRLRCPNTPEVGSRVAQTVGGMFCKALGISNLDVASIAPEREPLTLIIKRPAARGEPERLAAVLRRLNAA
jgi:hypothetical protein